MTEQGAVTVLVISYNHAPYVVECLDSIRHQTYAPARVLIADDASLDESARVIREYLQAHPDFPAEFQPNTVNLGLLPTLNRLFDQVSTEYFTLIAADDFMAPERLAVQVGLLERSQSDVAYSDATVVDENSQVLHTSSRTEYPWPAEPGRTHETPRRLLDGNWLPAASLLLRTEAVEQVGGYPTDLLYEDYDLIVRLSMKGQFVYSEDPLVAVRRLDSGMMSTKLTRTNPDFLKTLAHTHRHYEATPWAHEVRSKRWEIAKAMARLNISRRQKLTHLWAARRGASKGLAAVAFHMAVALTGISRQSSPRRRVK